MNVKSRCSTYLDCTCSSLYYIMNLQFMILIYTHFVRQFYYIMNLQFMILIYTHFARQFYYIIEVEKQNKFYEKKNCAKSLDDLDSMEK